VVLLVDNYDSFVHNLARYVRQLGEETVVCRNDRITLAEIAALEPSHILLSPGPCTPREAGISNDVILAFAAAVPILGVCLGHQCIAAAFGGEVVRADRPVHGKASLVHHDGQGIFAGLPSPFRAGRYHSLVVREATLPPDLEVVARTAEGVVMAIRHRSFPVWGVQFHPESILTDHGYTLLRNFLALEPPAREAQP